MNAHDAATGSWLLSPRGWAVRGVAVVTWGLLLSSCRHLAVLAEGEWEPFQPWFHGDYRVRRNDGTVLTWSRRYRTKTNLGT